MSSRWWMWWRSAERQQAGECLADGAELQSYLDGELDAPAARRVRAHVARCHRCARELAAYQRITNALASRGAREGPDEAALGRLRDLVGSLGSLDSFADPAGSRAEERPQDRSQGPDQSQSRIQDQLQDQLQDQIQDQFQDGVQGRGLERAQDEVPELAPDEAPLPPGEPDASESAVPKAGA
ncbi:anti-sigma factor family protein [Streptomyces milbemycinicus]|uniref:Anti-sigma factor family protein n=1 Tax=Streptomyces milbemycinicus TaxID=476552 RepID=A0ABW8LUS1_9ACTN